MQIFSSKQSLKTLVLLFCSVMTLSLTGCKDDDPLPEPEPEPVSYLSLYHASPDAPELNLLVNNQKIAQTFRYPDFYTYFRVQPASYKFQVNAVNATSSIVEKDVNLEENKFYSVFLAGRGINQDLLVIQDELPTLAAGKAAIRFIHLSPDAPAANLEITGTNASTLFANVAFKSNTPFMQVDAGVKGFQVKQAGENGEVLRTVSSYNFVSGRNYTVLLRGLKTPPANNTNALDIQVVAI